MFLLTHSDAGATVIAFYGADGICIVGISAVRLLFRAATESTSSHTSGLKPRAVLGLVPLGFGAKSGSDRATLTLLISALHQCPARLPCCLLTLVTWDAYRAEQRL